LTSTDFSIAAQSTLVTEEFLIFGGDDGLDQPTRGVGQRHPGLGTPRLAALLPCFLFPLLHDTGEARAPLGESLDLAAGGQAPPNIGREAEDQDQQDDQEALHRLGL
jgi:hypothetical protein